jgi:hypothetical protein
VDRNIHLNAGGVIGALLCGGIVAAILFAKFKPDEAPVKFIIVAVVAGAFAGNLLWDSIFKKPPAPSEGAPPASPSKLK